MKKLLVYFILGGVIGWLLAYGALSFADLHHAANTFVIFLLVVVAILISVSLIRSRQIKKLHQANFTGDADDEADALLYKRFTDYTLYTNAGFVIALLASCLSIITSKHVLLIGISIVLLILNYILQLRIRPLMRFVYPERSMPKFADPNYEENFLKTAGDGEKHVILHGLYRSFNLMNVTLIGVIVLATMYSLLKDNSQIFSIIVMSIVLLVVNAKYLFVVRNK